MNKLNIVIVAMFMIAMTGIINVASAVAIGTCDMDNENSPCNQKPITNTYEHVKQVKNRIAPMFLRMPGVTGVGITQVNNEYAIFITLLNVSYNKYIPVKILDVKVVTKVSSPATAVLPVEF